MNRIDRLFDILVHLQGKSKVTMEDLIGRFELSRRTIFRDIKALIESGVPIGGDAGEGYFIVQGYHLPPVVFNKEEAASLLIGAKFVEKNADSETIENFENALNKVKAVVRYSDKEFLEGLENNIAILSPSRPFPKSHITEIQYAIASNRTIDIEYLSTYKDQLTNREVEPLGMVFYSQRWHLIAFCRLREDLRDFRTDRIQKIRITQNTFDKSQHPNYLKFLERALIGTDAKETTILFDKMVARYISEQKHYYGFVSQVEKEDKIEMIFVVPNYEWLARWLMSFGDSFRVLNPKELQDLVSDFATELFEHHRYK